MSEEIKTTEQKEQTDLSEQELDGVAGGKTYNETRSNTTAYASPVTTLPITPKVGTPKAG